MPTSESSERLLAGKGLPAFIRRAICLEVDCNVKREVRESFGETWKGVKKSGARTQGLREGRCDKPS